MTSDWPDGLAGLFIGAVGFIFVGYVAITLFEVLLKTLETLNSPWYIWLMFGLVVFAMLASDFEAIMAGGLIFSVLVLLIGLSIGDVYAVG